MLEAEMPEGDLAQFTQAIQNALRGPPPAVQRLAPPKPAAEPQDAEVEAEFEEEVQHAAPIQRANGPRKPAPTPNVLELDLTSGTSLAEFAQKASPKSHPKRYLVIAAWFKEHRKTDAITAAHAYTCYRKLKWPLTVPDFAQPLRES
jgi:hypothetical protein